MKTTHTGGKVIACRDQIPPLCDGDQLTQVEFHQRYEASPSGVNAELIGGVVRLTGLHTRQHATCVPHLSVVFSLYEASTPGTEVGSRLSTILGPLSEVQPDLLLRLETDVGGQTRFDADDYLVGGPELVAEVAYEQAGPELNEKQSDYVAAGVLEYVIVCLRECEIHWFQFPSRRKLRPDKAGVFRSRVFPGLWLDGPALFARGSARLMAAAQQGVTSPEHVAFVAKLAAAKGRS